MITFISCPNQSGIFRYLNASPQGEIAQLMSLIIITPTMKSSFVSSSQTRVMPWTRSAMSLLLIPPSWRVERSCSSRPSHSKTTAPSHSSTRKALFITCDCIIHHFKCVLTNLYFVSFISTVVFA